MLRLRNWNLAGLGKVFSEILMNESSLFHLSVRLRRRRRRKVKKDRIKLKNKLNNKKRTIIKKSNINSFLLLSKVSSNEILGVQLSSDCRSGRTKGEAEEEEETTEFE